MPSSSNLSLQEFRSVADSCDDLSPSISLRRSLRRVGHRSTALPGSSTGGSRPWPRPVRDGLGSLEVEDGRGDAEAFCIGFFLFACVCDCMSHMVEVDPHGQRAMPWTEAPLRCCVFKSLSKGLT